MTPITAAFVGVAHIHTPAFVKSLQSRAQAGEVRIKTVWDHDSERGRRRAAEIDGAQFAERVDAVWSDPEITAVVVCAETSLHRDLVIAAAGASKDVFCEKPLGMGAKDANAMADAIDRAGVRFQTGFFMRSTSASQFIKREVALGHLGKLTRAHYTVAHGGVPGGWFDTEWRWLADKKLAGGGALLDLGAHSLDLALSTFSLTEGEVIAAKGMLGSRVGRYGDEVDEFGTALLSFTSGFQAIIDASWDESGPLRPDAYVAGTEGQILVRDGAVYYSSERVAGMDGKSPLAADALPPAAPHAFDIFWDDLLGRPTPVLPVSAREAALGSEVMERVYIDAGKVVTTRT